MWASRRTFPCCTSCTTCAVLAGCTVLSLAIAVCRTPAESMLCETGWLTEIGDKLVPALQNAACMQ